MKKLLALTKIRLAEYYRDKSSLGWNFVFPFFIVFGFYFIFDSDNQDMFKVGVPVNYKLEMQDLEFLKLDYIDWIEQSDLEKAQEKIAKHKLDMLITKQNETYAYWVNSTSKNAYLLEQLLKGTDTNKAILKNTSSQEEVSYLNWVIPGILAMNIMFNCLWGVGYVIVKYRQNQFLKRLKATPIKAYHYLLSQIFARYIIAGFVTLVVFVGTKLTVGFEMNGSYFDLAIAYTFGITCIMSIGLLVASRTTSKELADGLLNFFSWPMMILCGVWFSIEGANPTVLAVAQILPLTHLVDSTRAIITEGKTLSDVSENLIFMAGLSVVFITSASLLFKWNED
ncbi:MAG: ABC transporter permease [Bdellovibrionales bacterium]